MIELAIGEEKLGGSMLFSVLEECLIQELQRFDAVDCGTIPVFYEEGRYDASIGCIFLPSTLL